MKLTHTVKGVKMEFLVGLYFLGKVREKYNIEIAELVKKIQQSPTGFLVDIIYDSHTLLCELDNVKPVVSKSEFIVYLDENQNEFNDSNGIVSNFIQYLQKTLFGDFPITPDKEEIEEPTEEEVKKK